MAIERAGDLIIPQGASVLIQDGASGMVDLVVGPYKMSLADTDKPVIFDPVNNRYERVNAPQDAMKEFITANDNQYIVLMNPTEDGKQISQKGKANSFDLKIGQKVNIKGPISFPLLPGQSAVVIEGHQLRSNEYLLIRVYNEETAIKNFDKSIVRLSTDTATKVSVKDVVKKDDLVTGKLVVIKGTDVSFYIPPTGIEVLVDETNKKSIRNAITLERLEYCILLDQNGEKSYTQGPAVVFPKPTETFVDISGSTKFKAIELNDNMGIYIKVIASYTEGTGENVITHEAGEELFITGKEQKIYYPRTEHAVVKYGDNAMHYAVALPDGEGRYVLDKDLGKISLIIGPKMLLPDPRKEVIVRRVLDRRTVELMYPGNAEAILYNESQMISESKDSSRDMMYRSSSVLSSLSDAKTTASFSAVGDSLNRGSSYHKPRTITIDSKFEGAVSVNIWPGYAVQIVKKDGSRTVVEGPKSLLLQYDETLEQLELSTGKPKTDQKTFKTVYLQVQNNIVSDIITVETKDSVQAEVRLSYRVNFEENKEKWFTVANYVKLLTQHLRSVIRNTAKKITINELNSASTDIIRNSILGEQIEGKGRPGKVFTENGMKVYDVEVLDFKIGDTHIAALLKDAQHHIVERNIEITKDEKDLEYKIKREVTDRTLIAEKLLTSKEVHTADLVRSQLAKVRIESDKLIDEIRETIENYKNEQELLRLSARIDVGISKEDRESVIRTTESSEKMKAITPQMIEAIYTLANVGFADTITKNIKSQASGLAGIFGSKGGWQEILELVKGTPLETKFMDMAAKLSDKTRNKVSAE